MIKLEMCSATNEAKKKKEIGRAKESIIKQLELEMRMINAGDFMERFSWSMNFVGK